MKNNIKLFEAMRSIAIIAFIAVIGFSIIACGDDGDTDKEEINTNIFPEALAGSDELSYVYWDNTDTSSSVKDICFHNVYTYQSEIYINYHETSSLGYTLSSYTGNTYELRSGTHVTGNYKIIKFTAIVGTDGKLTISDVEWISNSGGGASSLDELELAAFGGTTYTKRIE